MKCLVMGAFSCLGWTPKLHWRNIKARDEEIININMINIAMIYLIVYSLHNCGNLHERSDFLRGTQVITGNDDCKSAQIRPDS